METMKKIDPASLQNLNPYQVLSVNQWFVLADLSPSTGWKLLHSGEGPPMLRITERRYGVRVIDHQKWTDKLVKEAP
jgi:hypothetical protein